MSDQNKTAVRRLFDELWNKGNLVVADELIAPNYLHHDDSTPALGKGPEGEKKRIEDLLAESETVVARWSCRGVHKGELNGIAPTGKQFAITGITITRFSNGKMVEGFVKEILDARRGQYRIVTNLRTEGQGTFPNIAHRAPI